MMLDKQLGDFHVNDTYSFTKLFTDEDFREFSSLSGDRNPLHHDYEYASQTVYEKPIVPLHLVASPLSAIAGMIFPGVRSLYLSHQLKALNPVPYNLELTYSAKIVAIDQSNQILTIRTIIFNDRLVFVEAEQKVQVRQGQESATCSNDLLDSFGSFIKPEKTVLVTGAAGALGSCIVRDLSRKGYKLVLQVRKKTYEFNDFINNLGSDVDVIECDLNSLTKELISAEFERLECSPTYVVHCASSPLGSEAADLLHVNYLSMRYITETLLPTWFSQQFGRLVFISSSALHYHPEGWDDYCAAKAAGVNYCSGIKHRYQSVGISTNVVAPGLMDTSFSEKLNMDRSRSMLPEQVAGEVVSILEEDNSFYTWVEETETRKGNYGFISNANSQMQRDSQSAAFLSDSIHGQSETESKDFYIDIDNRLRSLIGSQLKLNEGINWLDAGVATTPKWDSLNHMLLLVEIERCFQVSISSTEMDRTSTYPKLLDLVKEKLKE